MRDNEPQHTDEGHNATTALSSTSNSSDVSSCYGAPLTKKIITTGQNQA